MARISPSRTGLFPAGEAKAKLPSAERLKLLGLLLHGGANLTQPVRILLKDSDGGGDPVPKGGVKPFLQYSPRDLDQRRVRFGVQF